MDCSHLYPSQDRLSGTGIDNFKEHVSSTGILTERERGGSGRDEGARGREGGREGGREHVCF